MFIQEKKVFMQRIVILSSNNVCFNLKIVDQYLHEYVQLKGSTNKYDQINLLKEFQENRTLFCSYFLFNSYSLEDTKFLANLSYQSSLSIYSDNQPKQLQQSLHHDLNDPKIHKIF